MFFYLLKSIPIVTYEIYLFTKVNADFYFVLFFSASIGLCVFFSLPLSFSTLHLVRVRLRIQFILQVILAFLTWAFPSTIFIGPNVDVVLTLFCSLNGVGIAFYYRTFYCIEKEQTFLSLNLLMLN